MSKICKTCGHIINEDEEVVHVINAGMDSEFVICEDCALSDHHKYHICDACGEWFTGDVIHDEVLSKRVTFTECPACHKDIVDCLTREEMLKEAEPYRFSVIVTFSNGYNRGYVVLADDRSEMLDKLMKHVGATQGKSGITNIAISEILLEEDIIK